ncbi:MAG: ribosome maturation factor RimP [Rhodomicrobiaceae bacterium]
MQTEDLDKRFVTESGLAGDIASLVEPVIADLGYLLVRVVVSGRDGMTVQIMADKADGSFGVKDCEVISRELSPYLDSHDPIPGGYHLEVSSTGIDRPLVRKRDFENWQGFEAKIETKQAIDGRKRFRGTIEGFEDEELLLNVTLTDGEEPVTLGFNKAMIASSKLIMSDELLKSAEKRNQTEQDG